MDKLHSLLIRHVLYPAYERFKGRRTMEHLRHWERFHTRPREEIEAYQLDRIRLMVQHAMRHVPYYQGKYGGQGITPSEIGELDEVSKLPLVEKEDVRAQLTDFVAPGYDRDLQLTQTGGSTGEPLRYLMGQDAFGADHAVTWRSRRWFGLDIGQPYVLIWGHSASFRGGMQARKAKIIRPIKDFILNRRRLFAYNLFSRPMDQYLEVIQSFQPHFLRGYTSALYVLAKYIHNQAIKLDIPDLKAVLATAEVLYDWQKDLMEEVFQCPVVNEYGSNECGMMAYSCPEGNLHIMDENVFLEVVKGPDTGPKDVGEIVVTQLHHFGVPLLRYRTGDVAQGITLGCKCGSNLRILEGLQGRTYDLIATPRGKFIHGQLFHHLIRQHEGVKQFQVIQEDLDRIQIILNLSIPPEGYPEEQVAQKLKDIIEDEITLAFEYVDEIDQTRAGKYRWIISEVSHQLLRDEDI